MKRRSVRAMIAGVLLSGSATLVSPPAAEATGIYAGACALTLSVGYSPALGLTPAPTSMGLSGSGPCVANTSVTSGFYSVSAAGVAGLMACGAGVATGTGAFFVVGFPYNFILSQIVRAGPIAIIALQSGVHLAAAGVFVQDPGAVTGCAGGGVSSATWTGALVFEDPTIPPET